MKEHYKFSGAKFDIKNHMVYNDRC